VFPALLAAYAGQAAYLSKFPNDVSDTFFKSVPGKNQVAGKTSAINHLDFFLFVMDEVPSLVIFIAVEKRKHKFLVE
jgi:hypothetical protein